MRVLIVSQDAAERQRAATALALREDTDVIEHTSPRDAAATVREGAIDVLVVDGDLQPKGGFSWLYELRAEGELSGTPRPPAVVMTARPQDQFLADWSGAEAVIRKPVDPFVLARHVAELAGAAPSAEAAAPAEA